MNSPSDLFQNLITEEAILLPGKLNTYQPTFYTVSEQAKKAFFYITFFKRCTISNLNYYGIKSNADYCLLYTDQGEGIIKYNGQDYTLPSGSILFIDMKLLSHIHAKEMKPWNFYFILLNGNNITSYYELCTTDGLSLLPISNISNIPFIIKKLEGSIVTKSIEDEAVHSKLITDLLTEIIIEKNNSQYKTEIIPSYILKIKELFDNNYSEVHTLDSIAKTFHRSKYKLSRDFTKYMNISPIEYLICRRIENAKELLCQTDDMIHDIGISIGMENTNHFISTFKKKTGVTPLTYRNQHQRKII